LKIISNNKINSFVSVSGENFSPKNFSNDIGLLATNSWSKNDPIPNRANIVRKDSAWLYQIGPIEDLKIDELTSVFIEVFYPVREKLMSNLLTNNLSMKCDLVVEIYDGEKPSVFFDHEFIKTIADLKAEIDIDLYYFTN
jgi:hypothetical protein